MGRSCAFIAIIASLISAPAFGQAKKGPQPVGGDWPRVGNDSGGMRYSTLKQIDKTNVAKLKVAWVYHTGDAGGGNSTTLECTPIVIGGVMYITTVRATVVALDASTGNEVWKFQQGRSRYTIASQAS